MAKISDFVASHVGVGSKENIWIQIGAFYNCGSGQVTAFNDFNLKFQGRIDTVVYKDAFEFEVSLLDQNAAAREGSCTVSVNGQTDREASYRTENGRLIIAAHFMLKGERISQNFDIHRINNNTETALDMTGKYGYNVHLAKA